MKEIKIEDLIEKNRENVIFDEYEDYFSIKMFDMDDPLGVMQSINLNKTLNNLDTVNKMLAIFDHKIVKPLIDFTKPLSEELKRLADEDVDNLDWSSGFQKKYRVSFLTVSKIYVERCDCIEKTVGATYFEYEVCKTIVDYLNKHKEEAVKTMEL